jgi:hypothetical protein
LIVFSPASCLQHTRHDKAEDGARKEGDETEEHGGIPLSRAIASGIEGRPVPPLPTCRAGRWRGRGGMVWCSLPIASIPSQVIVNSQGTWRRGYSGRAAAISSCLHPSSAFRSLRFGLSRGYESSSDGCASMASRQVWQRRFCRLSQLMNSSSQRRQVVGPAYAVGLGDLDLPLPCPGR